MQTQAGAIPFLIDRGVVKLILITSHTGKWIFPKGSIKADRTPEATAPVEALEEAGVKGRLIAREAGRYRYSKGGKKYEVILFPLEIKQILSHWEESYFRSRTFEAYPVALQRIGYGSIRKIVRKLCKELLNSFDREGTDR